MLFLFNNNSVLGNICLCFENRYWYRMYCFLNQKYYILMHLFWKQNCVNCCCVPYLSEWLGDLGRVFSNCFCTPLSPIWYCQSSTIEQYNSYRYISRLTVYIRVFALEHTFFQGFEAIPLQFVIKARQGVANEAYSMLSHHHLG